MICLSRVATFDGGRPCEVWRVQSCCLPWWTTMLFAIHGGRPCCSPCCNHVVCHLSWWTTMLPSCCLPSMVNDHVRCGACNYVVCHPWWTTMLFAMLQSCCLSFVMVDYLSLSLSLHTHTHTHTHTQRSPVCTCACGPLITFHHCSPWQLWAFLMGFLLIIIL